MTFVLEVIERVVAKQLHDHIQQHIVNICTTSFSLHIDNITPMKRFY